MSVWAYSPSLLAEAAVDSTQTIAAVTVTVASSITTNGVYEYIVLDTADTDGNAAEASTSPNPAFPMYISIRKPYGGWFQTKTLGWGVLASHTDSVDGGSIANDGWECWDDSSGSWSLCFGTSGGNVEKVLSGQDQTYAWIQWRVTSSNISIYGSTQTYGDPDDVSSWTLLNDFGSHSISLPGSVTAEPRMGASCVGGDYPGDDGLRRLVVTYNSVREIDCYPQEAGSVSATSWVSSETGDTWTLLGTADLSNASLADTWPTTTQTITGQTVTVASSITAGAVTVGAVTITGQTLTTASSLTAGAVTVGAVTVTGQTLTAASSITAGAVTVGGAATVTGQTLTAASSITAGAVTPGAVTITGQTLTAASSLTAGAVTVGAVTVTGQTVTVASSIVAGDVTSGAAPQTVTGQTLTATASITAGAVTVDGEATVTGATLTAVSSITAGAATPGPVTVTGQTLDVTAAVVAGSVTSTGAATVTGQTLTAASSVVAGAVTPGPVTVTGATLTVTAGITAGAATGADIVEGATLDVVASLISGSVLGQGVSSISGTTLVVVAEFDYISGIYRPFVSTNVMYNEPVPPFVSRRLRMPKHRRIRG